MKQKERGKLENKSIVISEQELVTRYGTDGQKASYEKAGRFISSNKQRVLQRARLSCEVEDMGNKKYRLTVFGDVRNEGDELTALKKSQSNLYKYICPLLLQVVMKKDNNHLVLSCHSIARTIEMINEYYRMVEFNKNIASRCLDVEEGAMYIFYGRVNSMVDNLVVRAINYLWSMKIISYDKIHLAQHYINQPRLEGRKFKVTYGKYVPMTAEEEKWYDEAALLADKICGIENESAYSRYTGGNAQKWKKIIDIEMGKHNIVNAIWAYDIRISNMDRGKEYLKLFKDDKDFPKKLSLEFRQRINNNAKKQYERNPEKYKAIMLQTDRDFLEDYEFISKVVIDQTSGIDESIREYQDDLKRKCTKNQSTYTTVIEKE
jgi:hypothetical protein